MHRIERDRFVLGEGGELVGEVLGLRTRLLDLTAKIRQQRFEIRALFGEALGFGGELVAVLRGGGNGGGKLGVLLAGLIEFPEAIFEASGLAGQLGDAFLRSDDFLLLRGEVVLKVLIIGLSRGHALLRGGVRAGERGDDGLQAADLLREREMVLRILFQ